QPRSEVLRVRQVVGEEVAGPAPRADQLGRERRLSAEREPGDRRRQRGGEQRAVRAHDAFTACTVTMSKRFTGTRSAEPGQRGGPRAAPRNGDWRRRSTRYASV